MEMIQNGNTRLSDLQKNHELKQKKVTSEIKNPVILAVDIQRVALDPARCYSSVFNTTPGQSS